MIRHEMKLQPRLFEKIKAGTKTIEMRLNDEKRRLMMPGDTIVFVREPEQSERLEVMIVARHVYPDFAALVAAFPPVSMGYDGPVTEHGMSRYYSVEDEARYGVVGLEIIYAR